MIPTVFARFLPALLLILVASGVQAATITVNTIADVAELDGKCSLREALQAANLNQAVDTCTAGQAGADQIRFSVAGTMLLGSPLPITEAVTISGSGLDLLTISGQGQSGIFVIETLDGGDDVTLQDMSLVQGVSAQGGGGAIRATRVDNLMLLDLRLTDNIGTTPGGAVYVRPEVGLESSVIISDCLFEYNLGTFGGAVYLSGPSGTLPYVEINGSRFLANEGSRGGGAFIDRVDTVEISRSVFADNVAQTSGGGVLSGGALHFFDNTGSSPISVLIDRSSMIGNYSYSGGGALYVDGGYTTTLINSTLHGNTNNVFGADAIALNQAAVLRTNYATLADNGLGLAGDLAVAICDDCSWQSFFSIVSTQWASASNCDNQGSIISSGYNIDTSGDCLGTATDSNVQPALAALSNAALPGLGFDMPVRKPQQGSSAVDGSLFTTCQLPSGQLLDADQLGRTRPVAAGGGTALCDIGAIEFQAGDASPIIFSDRFETP